MGFLVLGLRMGRCEVTDSSHASVMKHLMVNARAPKHPTRSNWRRLLLSGHHNLDVYASSSQAPTKRSSGQGALGGVHATAA